MIENESDLWAAITADPTLRNWFLERFEDRSRGGVPDAYAGAGNRRLWIELKVDRITWRRGQTAWAMRAAQRGERAVCLLWRKGAAEIHDTALCGHALLFEQPKPNAVYTGPNPGDALRWAMTKFRSQIRRVKR